MPSLKTVAVSMPPGFCINVRHARRRPICLVLTSLAELLEGVLFANIRFHDTVSRGRLLNRFGKDFEGVDSNLPDNFGRSVMYALSATTTFASITYIGGLPFSLAAFILGCLYYSGTSPFLTFLARDDLFFISGKGELLKR